MLLLGGEVMLSRRVLISLTLNGSPVLPALRECRECRHNFPRRGRFWYPFGPPRRLAWRRNVALAKRYPARVSARAVVLVPGLWKQEDESSPVQSAGVTHQKILGILKAEGYQQTTT